MKVSASWQANGTIRVSLVTEPGELHPKVKDPAETEEWLKTLLEPHGTRKPEPKDGP